MQMFHCRHSKLEVVAASILIACAALLSQLPVCCAAEPVDSESPANPTQTESTASHRGFVCPEGFIVEAVASEKWVHDAFSMTTDPRGNPVVSGPGFIRTLTEVDASGQFTRAIDLKAAITQGAQGLWCEVGKYYFVADGGLWVVDDINSDCVADSPRKKILDLPTGGEHDAHAIRRGPDGWWYLIAGNFAATIGQLKNDPDSPVPQPRAGTLWRMSPDFSRRGVWAHGLRNAYDFDFLADGSIVTFDSDEERELALPWYRQTRVSVLSAGSDSGWVNTAWSDLASRTTMPHTLSRLGRGSPTGVKVYDHTAYPQKYHNAIFVADWTFGRILAIYPQPKDVSDANQAPQRLMAETFLQTTGNVGFAPTDITVAPDGSLLICSGGRGTTGALYRVRYESKGSDNDRGSEESQISRTQASAKADSIQSLAACLSAPSPLEAWSRAKWEPIWQRAPLAARIDAISSTSNSLSSSAQHSDVYSRQRRAIQCEIDLQNRGLISVQQRINSNEFKKLCFSTILKNSSQETSKVELSGTTRQTAWWALGHLPVPAAELNSLVQQLNNIDPSQYLRSLNSNDSTPLETIIGDPVIRAFYECIGLRRAQLPSESVWSIHRASASNSRSIETQRSMRQAQLWAASRVTASGGSKPPNATNVGSETREFDSVAGVRLFGASLNSIDAVLLDQLAFRCSKKLIPYTTNEVLESLLILQASLGDYRSSLPAHRAPSTTEVIDGYRCLYGSKIPENIREGWVSWCTIVARAQPSDGSSAADAWRATVVPEVLRAVAMLASRSPEAVSFCLEQITPSSHPTSDIHALIALSCCTGARTLDQTRATGDALSGILQKVSDLSLDTESKWPARLEELWKRLISKDSKLTSEFASRAAFGTAYDLFWLKLCPQNVQSIGQSRYKDMLMRTPEQDWDASVARFVWRDPKQTTPELYNYLRSQLDSQSRLPRPLAIELLSNNPSRVDYPLYLAAIESSEQAYLPAAWNALSLLPVEDPQKEIIAITGLWNRTRLSKTTDGIQKTIAKRMRMVGLKLEGKLDGSGKRAMLPSSDSWSDWEPFLKDFLGVSYPSQNQERGGPENSSAVDWRKRVNDADKLVGKADRGQLLYQGSKCNTCHGGENAFSSNALGPSLTGVAKRFSSEDLFRAIFEPSRDIPDRYRATKVLTTEGKILIGMKIYDSVDGITLQLPDGTLSRINQADIEEKAIADQSLMPSGLLDSYSVEEIADLYAYLQSM
jgi:putative heme-binding domain-containing protein